MQRMQPNYILISRNNKHLMAELSVFLLCGRLVLQILCLAG